MYYAYFSYYTIYIILTKLNPVKEKSLLTGRATWRISSTIAKQVSNARLNHYTIFLPFLRIPVLGLNLESVNPKSLSRALS